MNQKFSETLKADLSAGLVVFLVALPLCLGISLASGAPLTAGIISGAIAGLVVSFLSGSEVSVSGPAAGLTVIVAAGISGMGDFRIFLCAVILAGLLQILFSVLRLGILATLIPNSVITGLLAAIGLIIILKQIPHGLGRDTDYEGDMSFFQFMDGENTFSEIILAVLNFSPGVLLITVASLAILLSWDKVMSKLPKVKSYIPASLVAVAAGIGINELYFHYKPDWFIAAESGHLVSFPVPESFAAFGQMFTFPQFSLDKLSLIISTAIIIAIVASVETLLCLEAGDKIDPMRRNSNGNRELFAQGVGNILSGILGGLPMTSVVVRTSANIYAGAKTRLSVFIHGLFLLASFLFIPNLLNKIPLASLAAILMLVGYKLSSVKIFRSVQRKGIDQFAPFVVTVVSIVLTDILTGVVAGMITSAFFAIKGNYHSAVTVVNEENNYMMRFTRDVSFVNKIKVKRYLSQIPANASVIIDGAQAIFIDKDILELITEFKAYSPEKNIHVELRNLTTKQVNLFRAPSTFTPSVD